MGHTLICQALDGHDLPPLELYRQSKAGKNRFPIYENRTSTTLAELASMLRARKSQVLPQDLEKRLMRRNRNLDRLSIDHEAK